MGVLLKNNATSRLASSLTAGATTLSVTSGDGAKFPSPTAEQWFPLTVIKASGTLEIMRCTARSGDVLTVVRAQEGTAAQAFTAGDRVELRLTAAALAEFKQTDTISAFMQGMLDDANAGEARQTLELGSAAQLDAQESANDTTPNRLLRTGAFGLGGDASPKASNNPCGFYCTTNLNYIDLRRSESTHGFRLSNMPFEDRFFLAAGNGGSGLRPTVEIFHSRNMPTLTAGNGLTGGGVLNASRTITLGTPGTISRSTGNSVSATSHTHALSLTTADITSLTAGAGRGAVGTYAFLRAKGAHGETTSGSNLEWGNTGGSGGSVSGTWRIMGNGWTGGLTLWLRIA